MRTKEKKGEVTLDCIELIIVFLCTSSDKTCKSHDQHLAKITHWNNVKVVTDQPQIVEDAIKKIYIIYIVHVERDIIHMSKIILTLINNSYTL